MVGLEGVEGGVGLMVGWEWELGGGLWWHRAWLMGRDMVCNGVSACLRVDGRSGAGGRGSIVLGARQGSLGRPTCWKMQGAILLSHRLFTDCSWLAISVI